MCSSLVMRLNAKDTRAPGATVARAMTLHAIMTNAPKTQNGAPTNRGQQSLKPSQLENVAIACRDMNSYYDMMTCHDIYTCHDMNSRQDVMACHDVMKLVEMTIRHGMLACHDMMTRHDVSTCYDVMTCHGMNTRHDMTICHGMITCHNTSYMPRREYVP